MRMRGSQDPLTLTPLRIVGVSFALANLTPIDLSHLLFKFNTHFLSHGIVLLVGGNAPDK